MHQFVPRLVACTALVASPVLALSQGLVQTQFIPPIVTGAPLGVADLGFNTLFDGSSLWIASPSTTLTPGTNRDGILFRYERSGGSWQLAEFLTRPGGPSTWAEEFGRAIARTGNILVVTVPEAPHSGMAVQSLGVVQIFRGGPGAWVADAGQLVSPTPSGVDQFGRSVAAAGDWIAVGAGRDDGPATAGGAVILYEDTPTGFQFHTKLVAPAPVALGRFGTSVAMAGDLMIVGEPGNGDGLVHVYQRSSVSWNHLQTLTPISGGTNEQFGASLSLDLSPTGEATLAIGSPAAPPGLHGAIEIHERVGGAFQRSARFGQPLVSGPVDRLGAAVAADGDRVVAGASFNSVIGTSGGAAFVFERDAGGAWALVDQLLPAEARAGSQVGFAVDVQGEEVVVGAVAHSNAPGTVSRGACWLYEPIPEGAGLFGFGDGVMAPCPCGTNSTPGREQGCVNLSGLGGQLVPNGSASAALDVLELDVRNLNGVNTAILFEGTGPLAPAVPIGNGLLYMAPGFRRLGVVATDVWGQATWSNGLISSSGWSVGQTVMLQAWYRDPNAACSFTYNLTGGVRVVVQP